MENQSSEGSALPNVTPLDKSRFKQDSNLGLSDSKVHALVIIPGHPLCKHCSQETSIGSYLCLKKEEGRSGLPYIASGSRVETHSVSVLGHVYVAG